MRLSIHPGRAHGAKKPGRLFSLWLGFWLVGIAAPASAHFHYFDPTDLYAIPEYLSESGVFDDIGAKVMDTAAKYYEVNAPLWSDGALKRRWIILPPGQHIPYDDTTDFFDYPDSTVFVKTFLQEKVEGDTGTAVYWETRLWVKKIDASDNHKDWYGFSYQWNADQSDAILASPSYHGLDTIFPYTDASGRQTYKKWHFPSQQECWYCHAQGPVVDPATGQLVQGRSVLGFYPAQLKRASPLTSGMDQVLDLFRRGVFTGTPPDSAQLLRRFHALVEPNPGLSPTQRFAALDTMARSYLAANCSHCHGQRGQREGLCPVDLNFDYYNLVPQMEFGMHVVTDVGLNDVAPYDSSTTPTGRSKFLLAVTQGGMDTASGAIWDMALPAQSPNTLPSVLLDPGYPAASEFLFRLWSRATPAGDSGWVDRCYRQGVSPADGVTPLAPGEAAGRSQWIFAQPWGSSAWLDTLARRGLSLDSLVVSDSDGYDRDPDQMPPFLTFRPDTAALRLLGEWAKHYRTLTVVDSQHVYAALAPPGPAWGGPVFRGRDLFVPTAWTGTARMLDLHGRVQALKMLGPGRYALPANTAAGVCLFQVGPHFFKATLP